MKEFRKSVFICESCYTKSNGLSFKHGVAGVSVLPLPLIYRILLQLQSVSSIVIVDLGYRHIRHYSLVKQVITNKQLAYSIDYII